MKYITTLIFTTLFSAAIFAEPPFDVPPGQQNNGNGDVVNTNTNTNNNANINSNTSNSTSSANGGSGGSSASNIGISTGGVVVNQSTDMPKDAAHSAAHIYAQSCQEGASGQSYSGGAASVMESAMCQSLKMAQVHQGYWKMYSDMGDTNQADMHKQLMDKYIAEASDSADITYWPKTVGSVFLSLLPIGLLFLLI